MKTRYIIIALLGVALILLGGCVAKQDPEETTSCAETVAFTEQFADEAETSPSSTLAEIVQETQTQVINNEATVLESAMQLAEQAQYRAAIHLLEQAWLEDQNQKYYDAAREYRQEFGLFNSQVIAAGEYNTILCTESGGVITVGSNGFGELSSNSWTNIAAVSAGDNHIVGLRSDGTVVAAGSNVSGRCNVADWKNVVAISAGDSHTVALLENGALVATGYDEQGQCNMNSLMAAAGDKQVVSVAAGYYHTVALLEDGSVIACGETLQGACDVSEWENIVSVCAGAMYTAGLKSDGSVVVAGHITDNWDISAWTDIQNLCAGDDYLLGLKSDGSVCVVGFSTEYVKQKHQEIENWTDISLIAAGHDHTVAITKAGEVICTGVDTDGLFAIHGKMKEDLTDRSSLESLQKKVKEVVFDYHPDWYDGTGEYAVIRGLDENAEIVWTHKTATYDGDSQYSKVADIGRNKDRYYYCEEGTVVALDLQTGVIIWWNSEFDGAYPVACYGDSGEVYLAGYDGPDFFAIDQNGKTLKKIMMFDEAYFWPNKIEFIDESVLVTMDIGPEYQGNDFVFAVNTIDYSYSYQGIVPEEYISSDVT